MNIIRITSSDNPNNPFPWADLEINDNSLSVGVKAFNGLEAYQRIKMRQQGQSLTPTMAQKFKKNPETLNLRLKNPSERHVLAVTEEGEYEFVPFSQQRLIYYAHLAWYTPTTGEWEVLKFENNWREQEPSIEEQAYAQETMRANLASNSESTNSSA